MKTGIPQLAAGLALLSFAFVGLARDLPWVTRSFYAWAWWGWIFLLDGYCAARRASSLLSTRRALVPPLAIASVSFWFFFEALNLRFQNWYYVGCFALVDARAVLACAAFVVLAFATVFLGLFETIDALGAAGLWRSWQGRARRFSPRVGWSIQGLGAAMALLAIVFPRYLAPLIWGSFSFLIDPWNHRRGRSSLLGVAERGDYGRLARVLLAGLLCGLVWESLNFFSPQKWIYTVRGLEGLKLFEMPLLGFLGFPALALDSVAAFALLSGTMLGGASWEHPCDSREPAGPGRDRRRLFYASLPLQVAAWMATAAGVIRVNTGSIAHGLEHVSTLPRASIAPLARVDLARPRRLHDALRGPQRAQVLAAAGWSAEQADAIVEELRLLDFKGIGPWFAPLLRDAGVRRVEDLAQRAPEELHAELWARARALGVRAPRLDWVRVWVLASRTRGRWRSW